MFSVQRRPTPAHRHSGNVFAFARIPRSEGQNRYAVRAISTLAQQARRVLRQEHTAGERFFVDRAGTTLPMRDPEGAPMRAPHLLVAVLGSNCRMPRIAQQCTALRMPAMAGQFRRLAEQAVRDQHTHPGYREVLLAAEIENPGRNTIDRRIKEAHLPRVKTLEEFDFGQSARVAGLDRRCRYHGSGTTWSPTGTTPVVRSTGQRFKFNLLSVVNNQGEMRFMLTEPRVNNTLYLEFLQRLMKGVSAPVFLILDGHPVHRSRAVRDFAASTEGRSFFPATAHP